VGNKQEHTLNTLTLQVDEGDDISVLWIGKSSDRDPGQFVTPILTSILERAANGTKRILLDFRQLAYMNSSTITPIIRLLDEAKRGTTHRITIIYDKSAKWQDLSFSALKAFATKDDRIRIQSA
jgi:hypothetical protein